MASASRWAHHLCRLGLTLSMAIGVFHPAHAQNYRKGDAVIIDLYGDGREVHNGIIDEVYPSSSGTSYSVKWDSGQGYTGANTGMVPASRLKPLGGASRPAPPPSQGIGNPPPSQPVSHTPSGPVDSDANYFVGKWALSKWGGGTTVTEGNHQWTEWLLYVSPGAALTIKADHTYAWADRNGKALTGSWRNLTPQEDVYSAGKNGLLLLRALDSKDFHVSFRGVKSGKDFISLKSDLGSFDGERVGASKGDPAWNHAFSVGDSVILNLPDNEQGTGVVQKLSKDFTGTTFYYVQYTDASGRKGEGTFPAGRMRRR